MRKTKLSVELLTVETFAITKEAAPAYEGTDTTGGPDFCPYACGTDDSSSRCC